MSLDYNELEIKWHKYDESTKLAPGMFAKYSNGIICLLGDLVVDDVGYVSDGEQYWSPFEKPAYYGYMPGLESKIKNEITPYEKFLSCVKDDECVNLEQFTLAIDIIESVFPSFNYAVISFGAFVTRLNHAVKNMVDSGLIGGIPGGFHVIDFSRTNFTYDVSRMLFYATSGMRDKKIWEVIAASFGADATKAAMALIKNYSLNKD